MRREWTEDDRVVRALQEAQIFQFSPEARQEIREFFYQESFQEERLTDLVREQASALAHLHAAEYSLMPAFAQPGSMPLPPVNAVPVTRSSARLAILKGDCSLIIWTHAGHQGIEPLSAADLTVFSGDASKLGRLAPGWAAEARNLDSWRTYGAQLAQVHRAAEWMPGLEVAESGVLQLQMLLWSLKLAVAQPDDWPSLEEIAEEMAPRRA